MNVFVILIVVPYVLGAAGVRRPFGKKHVSRSMRQTRGGADRLKKWGDTPMRGLTLYAGLAGVICAPAFAGMNLVYTPSDAALSSGLDAPIGVADFAPGFSPGAHQANGMTKNASYVTAEQLFGPGTMITISDIDSVNFWTKQGAVDSDPGTYVNWFLEVYTIPTGVDDDAWYGRRLNFEPYFSPDLSDASAPANTWTNWSTDTSGNQLRVFDANRGDGGPVFGTYNDPFLSDLQAGPVNWNSYFGGYEDASVDYRDEQIWFFGLATGSAWANGFDGLVDGMTVTLNDGRVATLNLVPAPGGVAVFAGLLALTGARRRR